MQSNVNADIDFRDDRHGALFVATVRRRKLEPGDIAVEDRYRQNYPENPNNYPENYPENSEHYPEDYPQTPRSNLISTPLRDRPEESTARTVPSKYTPARAIGKHPAPAKAARPSNPSLVRFHPNDPRPSPMGLP